MGLVLYQAKKPKQEALAFVDRFATVLASKHDQTLLEMVVTPASIQDQTQAEQIEFLSKSLGEEISTEGVQELKQNASFGSLEKIFPIECKDWCALSGVNAADCVAFRMERNSIRAEVVLWHHGGNYQIVRCNNVKQMAATKPQT